jgi:outer membrane receptor protein involved in Fe transport
VAGGGAAGTVAASTGTTSKNRWPGQYFLNSAVQYKVNDHVSGFLNIDNLLDRQPPALATSAAVYDFIGRRYRIGVRANY